MWVGVLRSTVEVRFARDSLLEEDGFEPSVPRLRARCIWARARRDPRRQREVGKEHAIEQGKILRASQREHVVARIKRRGRRSAASDPIPNHHQNARRGRERQRLHGRLFCATCWS
jgi:hypothetical protein